MDTANFHDELKETNSNNNFTIVNPSTDDTGVSVLPDGQIEIPLSRTCWVVDADVVKENLDEDANWLIDEA